MKNGKNDHIEKQWKVPGIIQFYQNDMGEGATFWSGRNPSGETITASTREKAILVAFDYGCRAEFD